MIILSKIKAFLFSGYRWIFTLLAVAIIAELIWAFRTLGGNVSTTLPIAITNPAVSTSTTVQNGSITLTAPKASFSVGEKIPVSINIDSIKATDGADIIISYDPKLLTVSGPVEVEKMYDDYPLNVFDNATGKISVSGISSNPNGKVAKGVLGTVILEAKAPGKTQISVDFIKDSTTDSNIIETKTSKELLGKVGNLEVEIK
ncbi:MAG: cohesin domain-containing protein [Candidatus Daviesbacteria bacterium]|nr:cohesin domain-containing protein [Candidatus Daviesbacteria bacterium]